jgi:hypothetical protein
MPNDKKESNPSVKLAGTIAAGVGTIVAAVLTAQNAPWWIPKIEGMFGGKGKAPSSEQSTSSLQSPPTSTPSVASTSPSTPSTSVSTPGSSVNPGSQEVGSSVNPELQEVCVKTSTGDVACGTPAQSPSSSPNGCDPDKTIDTQTDNRYAAAPVTWELKCCTRQEGNVVRCNFMLTSSGDGGYSISVMRGTQLVDGSGKEYAGGRVEVGDRVVGGDNYLSFYMTQDVPYKTSADFPNVNPSVSKIALLQVITSSGGPGPGILKFRNVPIN